MLPQTPGIQKTDNTVDLFFSALQKINPQIRASMTYNGQPIDIDQLQKDPAKMRDRIEVRKTENGDVLEFALEGKEKFNRVLVFVDLEGKPFKSKLWLILDQEKNTRLMTGPIPEPIFPAERQKIIAFGSEVFPDISSTADDDWLPKEEGIEKENVLNLVTDKVVGAEKIYMEASNIGTAMLEIIPIKPQ